MYVVDIYYLSESVVYRYIKKDNKNCAKKCWCVGCYRIDIEKHFTFDEVLGFKHQSYLYSLVLELSCVPKKDEIQNMELKGIVTLTNQNILPLVCYLLFV